MSIDTRLVSKIHQIVDVGIRRVFSPSLKTVNCMTIYVKGIEQGCFTVVELRTSVQRHFLEVYKDSPQKHFIDSINFIFEDFLSKTEKNDKQ